MNAVIYARYSCDNQREESIEGQLRECTEFADKNGFTILRSYIDRAFSAKTDNRPEFQAMIKDGGRKLFDAVIVWKLDRFARNRYDSARYKTALKKNGIKVISATETISNGAEGILLESLLEGMAEYYSADLAEKVIRGMTENALKCKYNGGSVPFGYIVDKDQHYQIDPLAAPYVLECFQKYVQGLTITDLVTWLNGTGLKNGRGKSFSYNNVQMLLKSRRYIGEYHYRDVTIPDGIPAIVPEDLFGAVQAQMTKNKKAPARHKAADDYLLSTKLFCGYCGASMCGECGTSQNGNVHRYYKCMTIKKRLGTCHKRSVRKDYLEDTVIRATVAKIMDDNVIESITCQVIDLLHRENTRLPLLEKQLQETESAIANLLNAIQMGILTKSTKERMDTLEAAREQLEQQIAQEKLSQPLLTADQIKLWLLQFRHVDTRCDSGRKILIERFVNSIYLYDDKLLINFNFRDGTQTVPFDAAKIAASSKTNCSDSKCLGAPQESPLL